MGGAMIRLSGLKLPLDHPAEAMPVAICERLGLEPQQLFGHSVVGGGKDWTPRHPLQTV